MMLNTTTRIFHVVRVVALIASVAGGLAVGAPWLLTDAPPSPEAVIAASAANATR
jgi:hypothetical protein